MRGLIFEPFVPPDETQSIRTDVVCFIGFCGLRDVPVPQDLVQWLQHEGWWGTKASQGAHPDGSVLYDVPLPIHSWEFFDRVFAWDRRPYSTGGAEATLGATYLGAAVRSFFVQGGRKCYVISCGVPPALDEDREGRKTKLLQLVPEGISQGGNRAKWQGLQHLLGIPEVAFVALPDLAELASLNKTRTSMPIDVPPPPPVFVECSDSGSVSGPKNQVVHLGAPACSKEDFDVWGQTVARAVRWIAAKRRDVQLLLSLPLPEEDSEAAANLLSFMHSQGWLSDVPGVGSSIASGFLQLVYPWLKTAYAGDLPANLEPPEGVLGGLMARNALTRGVFRSATALPVLDVLDFFPKLREGSKLGLNPKAPLKASPASPLIDRVSLLNPTPGGFRLLSDVTTSNERSYRLASISRTIGLVLRAARNIGEAYVLENSGERLWQRISVSMKDVLAALQTAGALADGSSGAAFQVRCDRSTMTQQDIDNGRVVVQVMLIPAGTIETMRIQLTMGKGQQVALAALGMEAA